VLTSADPPTLAEQVAAAVGAHPSVVRHGGTLGDLTTYLPGRRLVGVRLDAASEPVELGVVPLLDRPIPGAVRSLRRLVSGMCGGAPVDVTVGDVIVPGVAVDVAQPMPVPR
jgi:hypothetical protein